jgi:hydrogenase/urease accessory protein HupE
MGGRVVRDRAWCFGTLTLAAVLLAAGDVSAHGMSEADRQAMLQGGYALYLWLGAKHMLTGYDHLLFIFGVIFFLRRAREVVRYITAFTLGHSLTLVFATLWGISANYYLVDAVIALSVCYKGFDNLDGFRRTLGREPPNLLAVIFAFGLVHGFGLSTRLQQLPLGDDTTALVLRILSFNVGVEVGQVAALLIMIAVLEGWRRTDSFRQFSRVANGALVAAGVVLFLFQLHGYSHQRFPDDLGFSDDLHHHAHEKMSVEKARQRFQDNLLGEEGVKP